MKTHSGYSVSSVWQQEIRIWNVAVLVILIAINLKYGGFMWWFLWLILVGLGSVLIISDYFCQSNRIGCLKITLILVGLLGGIGIFSDQERSKKGAFKGVCCLQGFPSTTKEAFTILNIKFPGREAKGENKVICLWQ